MSGNSDESKKQAARENTELDRTQLSLCVSLIENGVNPEALANVIKDLRRQGQEAGQSSTDAGIQGLQR